MPNEPKKKPIFEIEIGPMPLPPKRGRPSDYSKAIAEAKAGLMNGVFKSKNDAIAKISGRSFDRKIDYEKNETMRRGMRRGLK